VLLREMHAEVTLGTQRIPQLCAIAADIDFV
jgi:hypothetical protein